MLDYSHKFSDVIYLLSSRFMFLVYLFFLVVDGLSFQPVFIGLSIQCRSF